MTQVGQIIAVSVKTLRRAEMRLRSCVSCDRTADVRFDLVLKALERVPVNTEFIMPEPARCPRCGSDILEHTLVELRRRVK